MAVKFLYLMDIHIRGVEEQDVGGAAREARSKLMERGEKLQVGLLELLISEAGGGLTDQYSVEGRQGGKHCCFVSATNMVTTVLLRCCPQAVQDKTQELEDGAANFASLAQELAKKMEGKKWWEL